MSTLKQKNIVSSHTFENSQLLEKELNYRDLEDDQRFGFAKQPCYLKNCPKRKRKEGCDGHVRMTTTEKAYELNIPIWYRVNPVRNPRARGTIYDVIAIKNIVYEFEYRSDPQVAIATALRFRNSLIRKGWAPHDLIIFISGGGIHLIIAIPEIKLERKTARRYNAAIQKMTEKEIFPLFLDAKNYVQALFPKEDLSKMNLEGYDIARLLSASGTWRPSTHDDDHSSLKNGIIRYVYNDEIPIRNEWEPMKNLIEKYYKEIEEDIVERLMTIEQLKGTPEDDELVENINSQEESKWRYHLGAHREETTANAVRRKIQYKLDIKTLQGEIKYRIIEDKEGNKKRIIDRSKLINQIVFVLCNFCVSKGFDHRTFIATFKTVINECCGNKYDLGKNLNSAMNFYVQQWEAKEERQGRKIMKNEKITQKQHIKVSEEQQNHLDSFLSDRCIISKDEKITKEKLYATYKEICEKENIKVIGVNQFTKLLSVKNIHTKLLGKARIQYYIGVDILCNQAERNNINIRL